MQIKLLALDIDGTLLTPRGEISPRNSAAISRARQSGVHIVLVTGRRFNSARELAQQLDMGAPLPPFFFNALAGPAKKWLGLVIVLSQPKHRS